MNRLHRSRVAGDDGVADWRFGDAHDVARFAERNTLLLGRHWCESWHLDRAGGYVCGTNPTPLDSLRSWADDPARLMRSFLDFRESGRCSPHWVVVEERDADDPGVDPTPGEADVELFMRLRDRLEVVGITLLDAVIFDGGDRWWSMCELLTGSTEWRARSFPDIDVSHLRRTV